LVVFDVTVRFFAMNNTLCILDFQLPRSQPVFARLTPNVFERDWLQTNIRLLKLRRALFIARSLLRTNTRAKGFQVT
jgi:hypothetical protein